MRFRWPADTVFTRQVLTVEQETCAQCQRRLHICDHRPHRIFTLTGPLEIVCKLARCPDARCPGHAHTLSPLAESQLTLPWWLIGWDVFCWLGHRRFARHWSVPQLQAELRDTYRIPLSQDALTHYLRRYQVMVAARQQDAAVLAHAYQDIDDLILTIDGLQPEKGHETLYVVRELRAKRVWFGEALLSSATAEVQRLLAKAKQWVQQLGKPVCLWMSDKQDAFVQAIAREFAGTPHRYCQNHFVRDVAKPLLEADRHAKVQMRRKVRGLRDIERQVLAQRQTQTPAAAAEPTPAASGETTPTVAAPATPTVAAPATPTVAAPATPTVAAPATPAVAAPATPAVAAPATPAVAPSAAPTAATPAVEDTAGSVVLDYCAAVRGILNDDQGGPLQPPGLRMAAALSEVRQSLQRNLEAKKGGARRSN